MKSHRRFKFYSFCYMTLSYALMVFFLLVFIDLAIGDSTEDVWSGRLSITGYLLSHAPFFLTMAGLGAGLGFILWCITYRKS
ncbi:hypothetical protein ACIPDS_04840 [Kluyvera sp. NPDC087067]|uniref:hypothetical protein n=1 Tax=unclassified Kluyvera TaxID=2619995 RepID=UPI001413258F